MVNNLVNKLHLSVDSNMINNKIKKFELDTYFSIIKVDKNYLQCMQICYK